MDEFSCSLQELLAGLDASSPSKSDPSPPPEEEDRETFPLQRHSYRLQLAHLETRLKDYSDRLQAKDREIALTKSMRMSPSIGMDSDQSRNLDSRILLLEEENRQLRGLSHLRTEVDRLSKDLLQAQRLKASLEAKFNDAALRLVSLEKREDSCGSGEEPDRMQEMLRKAELFKRSNTQLQSEVTQLHTAIHQAQSERTRLLTSLIPSLQSTLTSLQNEITALEAQLAELRGAKGRTRQSRVSVLQLEGEAEARMKWEEDRVETKTCYSPTSDTAQPSPRRHSPSMIRKSVPGSQMGDSMHPAFRPPSKPQRVITSRPAGLKRLKSRPRQLQSPASGSDEFADSFPEENEFM